MASFKHAGTGMLLVPAFSNSLTTRNSDSLDFYDVAVWSVREALLAAYRAGQKDHQVR